MPRAEASSWRMRISVATKCVWLGRKAHYRAFRCIVHAQSSFKVPQFSLCNDRREHQYRFSGHPTPLAKLPFCHSLMVVSRLRRFFCSFLFQRLLVSLPNLLLFHRLGKKEPKLGKLSLKIFHMGRVAVHCCIGWCVVTQQQRWGIQGGGQMFCSCL